MLLQLLINASAAPAISNFFVIGYKSIDGDITEEPDMIQYYATSVIAGQFIDNSDELELGMRETIQAEYIDFQDTLELDIISK